MKVPVSSENNKNDVRHVAALQQKIQNPEYMNFAIQRIATVLSRTIAEMPTSNKETNYGT
ncbi:MAG TPA: hypothetical protein VFC68_04930 [Treponemataceae bacterium]|nr:hypothetical protein [Treponemataceae bacterium]